jgi:hypothetical protein
VNSSNIAQELLLKDELSLLVLFRAFVCLVVLPPDHFFALPTSNVPHGVSAGGHIAVARLRGLGVHHAVEEEGFAMLAAEVLPPYRVSAWSQWTRGRNCDVTYTADNLIVVGQVGLAVLAAVNALGVEVDVVGEAHLAK